eukprot:ANDGO_07662.mRNA.1 Exosome complex exonuclease RRP6
MLRTGFNTRESVLDFQKAVGQAVKSASLASTSFMKQPASGMTPAIEEQTLAVRSRVSKLLESFMGKFRVADVMLEDTDTVGDMFLDRIDYYLDEANGLHKKSSVVSGSSALSKQQQQAPKKIKFSDVDNSNTRFMPRITRKPNALAALPEYAKLDLSVPKVAIDEVLIQQYGSPQIWKSLEEEERKLKESIAPHPYSVEIESLEGSSHRDLSAISSANPFSHLLENFEGTRAVWVDTAAALGQMVSEIEHSAVRVVAVDLEAHAYRSFQGIVCLMQVSVSERDYLVDTIALRSSIGPALLPIFSDPKFVKVLHGADMDVLWLQRDFGIYVVNLFDTGQAARILGLDSAGYAHSLVQYCNVVTDKKFQLADWRIRPLTEEMSRYARMDSHFLLYIFAQMTKELSEKNLLQECFARSDAVALKMYEKDLLTDRSHVFALRKYETSGRGKLTANQRAAFRELYHWRDRLARFEDESVQFVCPNAVLASIAVTLPTDRDGLLRSCNPRVPYLVRKYADDLVRMILACKSNTESSSTAFPDMDSTSALSFYISHEPENMAAEIAKNLSSPTSVPVVFPRRLELRMSPEPSAKTFASAPSWNRTQLQVMQVFQSFVPVFPAVKLASREETRAVQEAMAKEAAAATAATKNYSTAASSEKAQPIFAAAAEEEEEEDQPFDVLKIQQPSAKKRKLNEEEFKPVDLLAESKKQVSVAVAKSEEPAFRITEPAESAANVYKPRIKRSKNRSAVL